MQTIDLRGKSLDDRALRSAVPRAEVEVSVAADAASTLIDDVRQRGAAALFDQAQRFDGVRPTSIRVTSDDIHAAVDALPG